MDPLGQLQAYRPSVKQQSLVKHTLLFLKAYKVLNIKFISRDSCTHSKMDIALWNTAQRVAKVCVFQRSDNGTSTLICQGTAIQISKEKEYFVTAKHVLFPPRVTRIDTSKLEVYVNCDDTSSIPQYRTMEEYDWVKVGIYSLRELDSIQDCNECSKLHRSDYIYLAKDDAISDLEVTLLHGPIADQTQVAVVGFFGTDCMATLNDIYDQTGIKEIFREDVQQSVIEIFKEKRRYQKFACLPKYDNNILSQSSSCNHICTYSCITTEGLSGGMVVSFGNINPIVHAMHIGRNADRHGLGIQANHYLSFAIQAQSRS